MRANRLTERIAVIDERGASADALGDGVRDALANAGFDVSFGTSEDDADVVLRVEASRRSRSGILRSTVADVTGETAPLACDGAQEAVAEQLRETQRMESIAVLAGGIAHDFNNILSVISICADEALDRAGDDAARTCLTEIRRAVDRGAMLTRDLLSFSRRDVPEPRTIDINELIADAQRMLERLVGDDVSLVLSLGALDAFVRVDPNHWSSVLVNLALNARQAMPGGGALTIRTRDLELHPSARGREKAAGRYVEVEVTDTGCGIPLAIQERIFDPFFTTRAVGNGTGLGLSVVYGIVEQSGGWVEVESREDAGATFRVFVPVAPARTRSAAVPASTSRRAKASARILLVEDEEAVRRLAQRMLEREGHAVTAVGSAEEALIVADHGFDLLVTDAALPGSDGRKVESRLAERSPELLVLYTSGFTDGALPPDVAYLQKPYTSKALLLRVDEMLSAAR